MPQEFKLQSTAPMEMQEYLFAATASKAQPDSLMRHVRSALYFHRFQVMNWLMLNGVKIPLDLLNDQQHPQVGAQFPDRAPESTKEASKITTEEA